MSKCFGCKHRGGFHHICDECIGGDMYEKTVITNADRIRNMTDEELALYFIKLTQVIHTCDICEPSYLANGSCDFNCELGVIRWLKNEIK